MATTISTCPFCGGAGQVSNDNNQNAYVTCGTCNARGCTKSWTNSASMADSVTSYQTAEANAITAWNTRV